MQQPPDDDATPSALPEWMAQQITRLAPGEVGVDPQTGRLLICTTAAEAVRLLRALGLDDSDNAGP